MKGKMCEPINVDMLEHIMGTQSKKSLKKLTS